MEIQASSFEIWLTIKSNDNFLGGPIQGYGEVDGKFGKVIQFGVVSGGVACDNPNVIYPGIYTNLAYYLTWILDNMDYP